MNPDLFETKRHFTELRAKAEARLARAPAVDAPAGTREEQAHELNVHKIELEMQNEELRRTRIELEISRDSYLDLYAFAPVGYLTLNRDGVISEINLTGATLLGAERKKLLHRRFNSLIAPEDRDCWDHCFISMTNHAIGRRKFELKLKRDDGSVFHTLLDCLLVAQESVPPLVRVTLTDIDELKQAEKLLRDSNRRINLLLESSGEGIYVVDEKGLCTLANPACANHLGYASSEELLGRDMHRLIHSRHENGHPYPVDACPVTAVFHSGEPARQVEGRFWRKDGSSFPVEFSAHPMRQNGTVVGVVVNFNDITRRKQAEEQLHRLNETLEQRVREESEKNHEKDVLLIQQSRLAAIGEVIHNVSHHWRQPLSALSLVLDNIKDAYEFNEMNQAYLAREVADGQRLIHAMSATIDRFCGFFTSSAEKRNFSISETVNEAICLLTPAFEVGNIEVKFEPCREAPHVSGYPDDFARVMLNVLTNARDAIARKNIPGKILIKTEVNGKTATVSILDNGGGIPAELSEKVFDPYFTTKESATGTGLGLYLAKTIMERMGGAIALRNAGEGVEALLTLPAAQK